MANQTSVHFQPVKAGSEDHNQRLKVLDYVRQELTPQNEYWESDNQAARLSAIKANYTAHVGRKLHAKATPIREAVVVISPSTTMENLKDLAQAYKEHFGIEVFQIAIHRDEGHHKAKTWKSNLHAHLVADWTDHATGKTLKLGREDMARMQTVTAEVLHMARGASSERKHLTAQQYKVKATEEKAAALDEEIKFMNQDIEQRAKIKNENIRLNKSFRRILQAIRELSPSISIALDAIFERFKALQEHFTTEQAQTINKALGHQDRRNMAAFLTNVSSARINRDLKPDIGQEIQDIADDSSLDFWEEKYIQGNKDAINMKPLDPSFEPHFHR